MSYGSLSICAPDGHYPRVKVPDAKSIQLNVLMMSSNPKPSQPNKILIILGLIIKNIIEITNIKTNIINRTIFK